MKRLLLNLMLLLCALVVGSGSVWGDTYVKVTDASDIVDGGQYLIVSGDKAMSTTQNTNNRGVVSVTISPTNRITTVPATAEIVTLEATGSQFFIKTSNNNYLYAVANQNYLRSGTSKDNAYKWTITTSRITSSVKASNGSSNTDYSALQYNSTNNIFSCYRRTQDDVVLFKKQDDVVVTTLEIEIVPTKTKYEVGEVLDMSGFVLNADGNNVTEDYTMSLGGSPIEDGVTLSSVGKKVITVAYGGKEVEQNISVGSVTGIAVTTVPTKTSYDTGDSFDPTGMVVTASLSTGEPSDPDTWTKEVTGYTIDPEENLAPANTSVTITYATKTTTQAITVTNVVVTGVSLKASTSIPKDGTETMTPTFVPTNATNKNVLWESDNTSVATVTAAGVVTGVAIGSANITVTTEDGSYTATCAVTITDPKGTSTNPYTVAEVRGQASATTFGNDIYVIGYIVGSVNGSTSKCYKNASNLVDTNLLLADTPDVSFTDGDAVSSISGVIPVEVPSGTIRTNWGPKSNAVIGYKILLKGNAQAYFSTKGIKGTSEVSAVLVPVSITAAGYATFVCNADLDYSSVPDLKAYRASVSGTDITFEKVTAIPAGEGVLLQGAEGSYVVPGASSAVAAWDDDDNAFVRGTGAAVATGTGPYNYILNDHATYGIGFYQAAGQTVAKNRAYLQSATAAARIAINFEDETDGIANTNRETVTNNRYYNLQGVEVAHPTKGLYIVNGKVVIK